MSLAMKKIYSLFFGLLLILPSVSFAQTVDSKTQMIALLTQLVQILETQLQNILEQQSQQTQLQNQIVQNQTIQTNQVQQIITHTIPVYGSLPITVAPPTTNPTPTPAAPVQVVSSSSVSNGPLKERIHVIGDMCVHNDMSNEPVGFWMYQCDIKVERIDSWGRIANDPQSIPFVVSTNSIGEFVNYGGPFFISIATGTINSITEVTGRVFTFETNEQKPVFKITSGDLSVDTSMLP